MDFNGRGSAVARSQSMEPTRLLEIFYIGNGFHSRQQISSQQFQRGPTTSRHVRHLIRLAKGFQSRHRITASHDCNAVFGSRKGGENVHQSTGALIEGYDFKDAHGTIHDNLGDTVETALNISNSLWTDIQTHPTIVNTASRNKIKRLGIFLLHCSLWKGLRANSIDWNYQRFPLLLGFLNEFQSCIEHTLLHQTVSDRHALRLEEGKGQPPAENERIDLLEQSPNDGEFSRYLAASNHGSNLIALVGAREIQKVQFRRHQTADATQVLFGIGERCWDASCTGMSSMTGAKGIVNVGVRVGRQFLGKGRVVRFFLWVESKIFQQTNAATGGWKGINGFLG
mmetsp:Transcript_2788/g.4503  ORF Transcript_2788/g.4503 Transcript_2788/m.4503 type:complete len:340 (-) Transcript_2788:497-1516(-)